MAEPFKNLINAEVVEEAARHLARVAPGFDAARFTALALRNLEALEMKARAMQIADALEATLPGAFEAAAKHIEAALAPMATDDKPVAGGGLAGWVLWPVGEFVARRGLAQPERALITLAELTQRFTAEFALRPFIVAHPALCFQTLQRWTAHPSAHVRRLVSEGSRPRLPWGLQLKALIADPAPTLPLLRALQDDGSETVRRSVANHLNDIAKDHPGLVAAWLEEHLPDAPAPRRALLRHASRTLIKRGDARVLQAWGLGAPLRGSATLGLSPARVTLGEAVELRVSLASTAARAQKLVVDYAIHHVKADGSTSPKVFKGWTLELPPHADATLARRHAVRPITTRRYHAGRHVVELQVNGRVVASAAFDLRLPARR
ncbi:MAG: DNA alkylation repair protein [Rubrivivax sp.]|nr:DNA alkylation repair protein [Rubrivivax sp.]